MVETLGIVEVGRPRTELGLSAIAKRKLGGKTLLEWVVRRVSEAQLLDQVVVLVNDEQEHAECSRLAPTNTPVFWGSSGDWLGRYAQALEQFQAQSFVRLGIGNPFVDPVIIDRLVRTAHCHPECDYVGYCHRDGATLAHSHLGICAEWFKAEALLRAERAAKSPAERQSSAHFILSHPELFQLRFVPLPSELDRNDLRLSLEVEEDWDHVQLIYDALGPERLEWQRIAGLLDHNPEIRERMAILNQDEE